MKNQDARLAKITVVMESIHMAAQKYDDCIAVNSGYAEAAYELDAHINALDDLLYMSVLNIVIYRQPNELGPIDQSYSQDDVF